MSLAVVHSRALLGLAAPPVMVEVHLASGLPQFTLVGLAETEVKESRERVRSALLQCGFDWPHDKRITVNLAPADLPKDSGRFDLPIALGVLCALGLISAKVIQHFEFAGELSLSGELRPVKGALAMMLGKQRAPDAVQRAMVLPPGSAQEAALCRGESLAWQDQVFEAAHLLALLDRLKALAALPQDWTDGARDQALACWPATPVQTTARPAETADLSDVKGHEGPKRALEIAAAGGHSLLMVGPPGSGKSMLAQRLVGLLPPMTREEALESAAMLDLAGLLVPENFGRRLVRSPHHSASAVALVGGGSPPRPGEISLATGKNVLFLDEFAEFQRAALEALREPLETGHITIARAAQRTDFPAQFQLVAAMNPCPCGNLGAPLQSALKRCRCTPDQVSRYQGRLSGPLLDRIDLHVEVLQIPSEQLLGSTTRPTGAAEGSAVVAERALRARERAMRRQGCANVALQGQAIDAHAQLDDAAAKFLTSAAAKLGWSNRSTHRALKVARTIADLAACDHIAVAHLAEAMQYRRALSARAG
jgi:magnesium chelatase family protein